MSYDYSNFSNGRGANTKSFSGTGAAFNNGNYNNNNNNSSNNNNSGRPVSFRMNKPVSFRKADKDKAALEKKKAEELAAQKIKEAEARVIPMGEVDEDQLNLQSTSPEPLDIEDFDIEVDQEEEERKRAEAARERRRKRKREQDPEPEQARTLPSGATSSPPPDNPRNPAGIIASEKITGDPTNASAVNTFLKNVCDNGNGNINEGNDNEGNGIGGNDSDEFDMFSDSPSKIVPETTGITKGNADAHNDDIDDADGYYKMNVGDKISDRYRVLGYLGKGVFSSVLKCVDDNGVYGNVAVKIIRSNETMRKAATKEIKILKIIGKNDPGNKKCCVRLWDDGEHRDHIFMCFEGFAMNLREVVSKFGRDVGISVAACKSYARQLFTALYHLAKHRIVHADIKPDNILVSANFTQLKLCDFGSAFFETDSDNDPTPYLVSRFYRPPEVMLGLEYDKATDLWSIAVTLFELFTGRVMFPGSNNNDMLKKIMEVKGPLGNKMLRRHFISFEKLGLEPHFVNDETRAFREQYTDKVTGNSAHRTVIIRKPEKNIAQLLIGKKTKTDSAGDIKLLADLLEKCLTLDEKKRPSIVDVKSHEFVLSESKEAENKKK